MRHIYFPYVSPENYYHFIMFVVGNLRHLGHPEEVEVATVHIPYSEGPEILWQALAKPDISNMPLWKPCPIPHLNLLWTVIPTLKELRISNKIPEDAKQLYYHPHPNSMNRGTPYDPHAYMYLYNTLKPHIPGIQPLPYVYMSRSRASKRRILNEEALMKCLAPKGFVRVYMEDHPPLIQMAICRQAKKVVSAHGAALTNIVFCEPGTKVIEICSHKMKDLLHFAHIADIRYLDYRRYTYVQPTEPESYDSDMLIPDFTTLDIIVD
jgi:hypothetical protein